MATRQERMRDRMRGAGRHNVGDVDFGLVIPVAEAPSDESEEQQASETSPPAPDSTSQQAMKPTPNTSAKRKRLHPDASQMSSPPQPPATASSGAGESIMDIGEPGAQDEPMNDAPPLPSQPPSTRRPRGPLSSVISATKRLSIDRSPPAGAAFARPQQQEEVTESPADAPGSGRRRPIRVSAGTPVVESSTLLQKVLDELDDSTGPVLPENSSPIERRVATRKSGELRRARVSVSSAGSAGSAGTRRTSPRLLRSSVAESEAAAETSQLEAVEEREEEVGESAVQPDGESGDIEGQAEGTEDQEQEEGEAQEVDAEEAARRLGKKRVRQSPRTAPSPALGSGLVDESPAPKRRRRQREPASPAQQQQPVKKARSSKPEPKARPQPQTQSQPQAPTRPSPPPQAQNRTRAKPKPVPTSKPKQKRQRREKKSQVASDEDGEGESGTVSVTVQRFTKPQAGDRADGKEPVDDILQGDIPFANRGGVNAVDVLSKLCEELIEAYMNKLEERLSTDEDAASKREHRTMYRALEAFQEELRTRLLEHTIALDTLHALRKRVRAAQKQKLALRDEILRVRAERDQVALRMDAVRIAHEAESKQALRHISLSSAMHDIDLAVERGRAAPDLTPAEQKKADLANLELLISRVADQACTRSEGGGTLKQIKEFNAFLERAAAALEGR
ncbi:hypothetical protein VTK26DRAFT_5201 [Humicola hyalothermophila]